MVICERCGANLVDDGGVSFPYCAACDWCPDCGVTHDLHPDKRDPENRRGRKFGAWVVIPESVLVVLDAQAALAGDELEHFITDIIINSGFGELWRLVDRHG